MAEVSVAGGVIEVSWTACVDELARSEDCTRARAVCRASPSVRLLLAEVPLVEDDRRSVVRTAGRPGLL
jgi:hypothetical protein